MAKTYSADVLKAAGVGGRPRLLTAMQLGLLPGLKMSTIHQALLQNQLRVHAATSAHQGGNVLRISRHPSVVGSPVFANLITSLRTPVMAEYTKNMRLHQFGITKSALSAAGVLKGFDGINGYANLALWRAGIGPDLTAALLKFADQPAFTSQVRDDLITTITEVASDPSAIGADDALDVKKLSTVIFGIVSSYVTLWPYVQAHLDADAQAKHLAGLYTALIVAIGLLIYLMVNEPGE